MINKAGILFTLSWLVFPRLYRLGGVINIQVWELSLILCLLLWLFHIAIIKRINIEIDALNLIIIVFLLANIFSSIRIPEHSGAFMVGGMWYNLRTIEPVLLYFIVTDFLADGRNIKSLLFCMLIILSLESTLGIFQSLAHVEWTSGGEEATPSENPRGYLYYLTGRGEPMVTHAYGTFSHFNAFAAYLMLFVPLLVSLAMSGEFISRKVAIFLAGLTIGALLLTYSRSALLGTAVGLFIMILAKYKDKPFLLLISMSVIAGLAVITTSTFMSRGYGNSLSLSFRLDIWERTLKVIFRDPITFAFGTGSGTHLYWTQYEARGHYYSPHNSYLMIWLETGLIGVLSFVSIFVLLLVRSLKTCLHGREEKYQSLALGMLGIIPGLLIQLCFSATAAELSQKALILTFVALGASANKPNVRATRSHRRQRVGRDKVGSLQRAVIVE